MNENWKRDLERRADAYEFGSADFATDEEWIDDVREVMEIDHLRTRLSRADRWNDTMLAIVFVLLFVILVLAFKK